MTDTYALQSRVIDLGRLGENLHRRVVFDVSGYVKQYPDATFTLLNQKPETDVAYPVANVAQVNDELFWTVTSADLTKEGDGRCELLVMEGDVVAKSVVYLTRVAEALDGSGTAPEPWESWQTVFAGIKDDAESAATAAEAASQAVQDMGVEASTLAAGSSATVDKTVDPDTGAVTLSFGIPRGNTGAQGADGTPGADGAPGQDGYSPTVTVTDITGGHRVTITDANGDHSFDVMDGSGGGTSDYSALSNKPSINDVTLSGNKTTGDLGLYSKPSGGIPSTDMTDAVQASLGKADTALQSAPVMSVNSQTGAVTLTASDVGAGTYSKPSGGIPASDLASGVIPTVSVTVLTPTGNTHMLEPCPVTYNFGEKSELSVTVTATSQYHFMFSCPSATPTVLSMTGITGRAGDTLAAGKTYEVDVWAGIALIKAIEVTSV